MHIYIYVYVYIYICQPPPRRTIARCRNAATNPPTFRFLLYDPGLTLDLEAPGEHMSAAAFMLSSATLHADTPRDDFSNDESHLRLNTRS